MAMQRKQRVILIGCGTTALPALASLAEYFEVAAVIRDVGADERHNDEVVRLAERLGTNVYADTTPLAIGEVIRETNPDCVVVSSYNRILDSALLRTCRFVNVHYAPLPRYRGRACVNWAIINGEQRTAITVHELVEELDGGAMLFQQEVPIGNEDDVTALYRRLNEVQQKNLGAVVARYLAGDVGREQEHELATYGCTRVPDDGEIDWSKTTHAITDLVRSLTPPFPGAFTYLDHRRLTIWSAKPVTDPRYYEGRIPGRVVHVSKVEGYIDVLSGDGVVRLLEVQIEESPPISPSELIRSIRVTLGLRPAQLLARIAELERRVNSLTQEPEHTNSSIR